MALALVKNFPNGMYAEMAQQTLEKEGIPCVVKGSGGGSGPVVLQSAGGTWPFTGVGVDVYVSDEDLPRAKELLEAIYDGI